MSQVDTSPSNVNSDLKDGWLHAVDFFRPEYFFCGRKQSGKGKKVSNPKEDQKCPMCLAVTKHLFED
jgi:hypothetical protein